MPLRLYKSIRFSEDRLDIIDKANQLIKQYAAQGYTLTLRQIYYQFIAGNLLPTSWADPATGSTNNERSYKKLGDVLADARLAGRLDWEAIEDRTRALGKAPHWGSPADIIQSCAKQFRLDRWEDQDYRVEVWVEKDALEGVVGQAAQRLDAPYFSCRGYASATSIWDAGQRLKEYCLEGQTPVILHLGDHDPSGIDMSRDIEERVSLFMDGTENRLVFERIALTMAQIQQYNPPPNPAKVTDSRFEGYRRKYGNDSWELDALSPAIIDALITQKIHQYLDRAKYRDKEREEQEHKADLAKAAKLWKTNITGLLHAQPEENE